MRSRSSARFANRRLVGYRAIVVAIINMAKSLDLDTIAEGVETAGQLALLRSKGCHVGQGYFFSPPLTVRHDP